MVSGAKMARFAMRACALCAAAALAIAFMAGCSASTGTAAQSTASASSASGAAANSAIDSSESRSASGASYSADATATGNSDELSSQAASSDFDRMIVGAWRVYSMEYGNNSKTKIGNDEIALLREFGFYETMTFFADGTYQVNHGRGDVFTSTWEETGYNTLVLHEVLEDGEDAEATISSGRMTIEYEDPKYKHVEVVYSKQ